MEEANNIDPTLLGVIVGSVLSLLGNFIGQWFSMAREEKHWKRQRDSEREDDRLKRELEELNRISEIYQNCLTKLSVLRSLEDSESKENNEEYKKLYDEAVNWVTQLKLHLRDEYCNERSELRKWIDHFIRTPNHWTEELIKEINKQMITDRVLFPNSEIKTVKDEGYRRIQLSISEEYRKEQMIKGVSLNQNYLIDSNLNEFTESQREIFWDMYINGIPENIVLMVPKYTEGQNKVNLRHSNWKGSVNPMTDSIRDILAVWEKEYLELLEVEKKLSESAP
jgi:hypothetical protein